MDAEAGSRCIARKCDAAAPFFAFLCLLLFVWRLLVDACFFVVVLLMRSCLCLLCWYLFCGRSFYRYSLYGCAFLGDSF